MENYSFYLSISEKPPIWFCRANFPLQNLLHHIFPECNHREICESTFRYVLIYFTVFSILSIASSFLNELWNFFYQNNQRKRLYEVWYERKFSEYFVIFSLTIHGTTLLHFHKKNIKKSFSKIYVFQSCQCISSLVKARPLKLSEIKDLD
jgi:hypothetical protein